MGQRRRWYCFAGFVPWVWLAAGVLPAAEDATPVAADQAAAKVIFSDSLTTSVSPDWHLNHGTWKIVDGGWQGAEDAADKHAAAARYLLAFKDGTIEFDFRFDGARMISLSVNDAKAHLCRVQIQPKLMRVMKDDHDQQSGPDKAELLAEKPLDLQPGNWYHARIEFVGTQMTACIGDVAGGGKHELIATPKANFAFVVSGQTASFRNLRVTVPGEVPAPSEVPVPGP